MTMVGFRDDLRMITNSAFYYDIWADSPDHSQLGLRVAALAFFAERDAASREALARELVERVSSSRKRYVLRPSYAKICTDIIFERAVQRDWQSVREITQRWGRDVHGVTFTHYPLWKRVCRIIAPQLAASILMSSLFRWLSVVISGYLIGKGFAKVHRFVVLFCDTRVIPVLIRNSPQVVMRLFRMTIGHLIGFIRTNWCLLTVVLLATYVISKANERRERLYGRALPFISVVRRIKSVCRFCLATVSIQYGAALIADQLGSYVLMGRGTDLKRSLSDIVVQAQREEMLVAKNNAYAIWRQVMIRNEIVLVGA